MKVVWGLFSSGCKKGFGVRYRLGDPCGPAKAGGGVGELSRNKKIAEVCQKDQERVPAMGGAHRTLLRGEGGISKKAESSHLDLDTKRDSGRGGYVSI